MFSKTITIISVATTEENGDLDSTQMTKVSNILGMKLIAS